MIRAASSAASGAIHVATADAAAPAAVAVGPPAAGVMSCLRNIPSPWVTAARADEEGGSTITFDITNAKADTARNINPCATRFGSINGRRWNSESQRSRTNTSPETPNSQLVPSVRKK